MEKNPYLEIAGRKVGYDFDPLVIAELGINHNGDLNVAFEMVDAACEAGVEVLKHQTHIVDDEMTSKAKSVIPGNSNKSIYEIMKSCALDENEERALQEYVLSKNIIFISTPFSRAAADRLIKMDVPAFKIGSGECNNYPLIKHISKFGKPIILSTGMNSIESVKLSVEILEAAGVPFALLHTTNLYPTPDKLVRLGAMTELSIAFPNCIYGLSDHTLSNHACLGAVALGASILERHFTDHMSRQGPDIVCSMDKSTCKELIEGSKILKLQRGGKKGAVPEEQVTIDFAFATICSIKAIKKGDTFSEENIWVKRPGTGELKAIDFENLIGKMAAKNIANDTHLNWEDIL